MRFGLSLLSPLPLPSHPPGSFRSIVAQVGDVGGKDIGEEEGEEEGGHRMLLDWISAWQGSNTKELPELLSVSWRSWLW